MLRTYTEIPHRRRPEVSSQSRKNKPRFLLLTIFTRDDVVSQRLKFGSGFLSYFSWESKIALLLLPCFFNFSVSCARPEKLCDFYWLQLRITSQIGLHKQKKDTASVKEGKVSLLRTGGQRLKAVLKRRKSWPRVTENIVQVAQSGNMLVLVS